MRPFCSRRTGPHPYKGLVEGGVVSQLEYDAHEAEALADAQALEADRAIVTSEQHKIGQLRA